jgi:hypothetical protein
MDSRSSGGEPMKRAQIRERIKQVLPALLPMRAAARADAAGNVTVMRGDETLFAGPAGLLGGLAELLEAADGEMAKADERENDEDKTDEDDEEKKDEEGMEGEAKKKKEDDDEKPEGKMDSTSSKALAKLQRDHDRLLARFDSLAAGRDKLVADAVAAGERKASLVTRARVLMGERFDGAGLTEGQIHSAVLEQAKVAIQAGRSPDYIAARCDSVLEQAEKDAAAQRAGYAGLSAQGRMDGTGAPGEDIEAKSRKAMEERQRNAWQSKGA